MTRKSILSKHRENIDLLKNGVEERKIRNPSKPVPKIQVLYFRHCISFLLVIIVFYDLFQLLLTKIMNN